MLEILQYHFMSNVFPQESSKHIAHLVCNISIKDEQLKTGELSEKLLITAVHGLLDLFTKQ